MQDDISRSGSKNFDNEFKKFPSFLTKNQNNLLLNEIKIK
jgi:hypothetical protein